MTGTRRLGALLLMAILFSVTAWSARAQGRLSPEQQKAQFEKQFDALSKSLALTDQQRPEVRSILEKERDRRTELMQSMRQGQGRAGGREGMRTRMLEMDAETERALAEVLNEEQMKQYATFRAESRQQGGRRGGRSNPQDSN